jgi:DNA-binding MarR family transcriptional regulator
MSGPLGVVGSKPEAEAEAARLSMALGRVSRWIRRQHALPVGHGSLSALVTISREGPLRPGDLAAREGLAPASLSRVLAILVGEGYVDRQPDPADGRSVLLSTTSRGHDLLVELRITTAQVLLERLERLSIDERAAIAAALPALEALAADPEGCGDEH